MPICVFSRRCRRQSKHTFPTADSGAQCMPLYVSERGSLFLTKQKILTEPQDSFGSPWLGGATFFSYR